MVQAARMGEGMARRSGPSAPRPAAPAAMDQRRLVDAAGIFVRMFEHRSEPLATRAHFLRRQLRYLVAALLFVASLGNVLGAVLNWLLGRGLERFRDRRWFPVSAARLEQARAWYHRWGRWSLLLSWAPVIGDPLTVAAGVMREPLPVFLLIAGGAKVLRYLALTAVTLGWLA